MKVYESSHPLNLPAGKARQNYKKVPQVKIKNEDLRRSVFNIGKEFAVIYQPGIITFGSGCQE